MRSVVVTGWTAGIAIATADRFAADVWRVAVVAREFGEIDTSINYATPTVVARAHEITADEYARVTAMVRDTLAARRHMRPSRLRHDRPAFLGARDLQREFRVRRSLATLGLGQFVTPGFSSRRAAGMIGAQQCAPMPDREDNLDAPVAGPMQFDGNGGGRVTCGRRELSSSRQRDLLKFGAAGGLLRLGALAGLPAMTGPVT